MININYHNFDDQDLDDNILIGGFSVLVSVYRWPSTA